MTIVSCPPGPCRQPHEYGCDRQRREKAVTHQNVPSIVDLLVRLQREHSGRLLAFIESTEVSEQRRFVMVLLELYLPKSIAPQPS